MTSKLLGIISILTRWILIKTYNDLVYTRLTYLVCRGHSNFNKEILIFLIN